MDLSGKFQFQGTFDKISFTGPSGPNIKIIHNNSQLLELVPGQLPTPNTGNKGKGVKKLLQSGRVVQPFFSV